MKSLQVITTSMVILFASTAAFAQSKKKANAMESGKVASSRLTSTDATQHGKAKGLQVKTTQSTTTPKGGQSGSADAMGSLLLTALSGCINVTVGNDNNTNSPRAGTEGTDIKAGKDQTVDGGSNPLNNPTGGNDNSNNSNNANNNNNNTNNNNDNNNNSNNNNTNNCPCGNNGNSPAGGH